jgi:hypothetical protein
VLVREPDPSEELDESDEERELVASK